MNKDDQIAQALAVINVARQRVWDLHHAVKEMNEGIGVSLWECSLQIEHALLELNEALYGRREYL